MHCWMMLLKRFIPATFSAETNLSILLVIQSEAKDLDYIHLSIFLKLFNISNTFSPSYHLTFTYPLTIHKNQSSFIPLTDKIFKLHSKFKWIKKVVIVFSLSLWCSTNSRTDIRKAKKRLKILFLAPKFAKIYLCRNNRQQMLTLCCILLCRRQELYQYRAWAVVSYIYIVGVWRCLG